MINGSKQKLSFRMQWGFSFKIWILVLMAVQIPIMHVVIADDAYTKNMTFVRIARNLHKQVIGVVRCLFLDGFFYLAHAV